MTRRMEKVADQLQVEVADLLRREVKHPALTDRILSITRVEVSPDMGAARIHISFMQTAEDEADGQTPEQVEKEVFKALAHSAPFMHRELVKRLHMRQIPHLHFFPDHSIAEGDRITHLMREVAESEGRAL